MKLEEHRMSSIMVVQPSEGMNNKHYLVMQGLGALSCFFLLFGEDQAIRSHE